jgi:hypothetical protein
MLAVMTAHRSSFRFPILIVVGLVVLALGGIGAVLAFKAPRDKPPTSPPTVADVGSLSKPGTYLVSLSGLSIDEKSYVSSFKIATWGVTLLATCRYPSGWFLRSGSSANPEGSMEGEASFGATYLDRTHLSELNGLFLIHLWDGVQTEVRGKTGVIPATFDGEVLVGRYDEDEERIVKIGSRNVRLTPATSCPPPAK